MPGVDGGSSRRLAAGDLGQLERPHHGALIGQDVSCASMSAHKPLSKSQCRLLVDLLDQQAVSSEKSRPLKDKYRDSAAILARLGLIRIDISPTTYRHVVWLTVGGLQKARAQFESA